MFFFDEGPTLEKLDFTLNIGSTTFYISICVSTLPTQHTTFISLKVLVAMSGENKITNKTS